MTLTFFRSASKIVAPFPEPCDSHSFLIPTNERGFQKKIKKIDKLMPCLTSILLHWPARESLSRSPGTKTKRSVEVLYYDIAIYIFINAHCVVPNFP